MELSLADKILSLLNLQRLDIRGSLLYLSLFLRGSLTQSVEYLPFKQRVVGSSPTRPTSTVKIISSPSSSQVQDTGLSRRRHGFKSRRGRHIMGVKPDSAELLFCFCRPEAVTPGKGLPVSPGCSCRFPAPMIGILEHPQPWRDRQLLFHLFRQPMGLPLQKGALRMGHHGQMSAVG